MVKTYVETRLKLSGATKKIFTNDAFSYLYEYSEHGVPRLINKISKLCLKSGETNSLYEINGGVVRQIGERFRRLTAPSIQKRRPRKKSIGVTIQEHIEEIKDEPDVIRTEAVNEQRNFMCEKVLSTETIQSQGGNVHIEGEGLEEPGIGSFKIKLDIPFYVFEQAKSSTKEYCNKLAGVLAAQALKKHPELTSSPSVDPVSIWSKIRELILNRIDQENRAIMK
jgi:hypothetical protein